MHLSALCLCVILTGPSSLKPIDPQAAADAALLRTAKIAQTPAALLAKLREQCCQPDLEPGIRALASQLGNEDYAVREGASRQLAALCTPGATFLLRQLQHDADAETFRRLEVLICQLHERAPDLAVQAAAIRELRRQDCRDAIPVLLEFHAACADEWTRREAAAAFWEFSQRDVPLNEHLAAFAQSSIPRRPNTLEAVQGALASTSDPSPSARARNAAGKFFQALEVGDMPRIRELVALPLFLDESLTIVASEDFEQIFQLVTEEFQRKKLHYAVLEARRPEEESLGVMERQYLAARGDRIMVPVRARFHVEGTEELAGTLWIDITDPAPRIVAVVTREGEMGERK